MLCLTNCEINMTCYVDCSSPVMTKWVTNIQRDVKYNDVGDGFV